MTVFHFTHLLVDGQQLLPIICGLEGFTGLWCPAPQSKIAFENKQGGCFAVLSTENRKENRRHRLWLQSSFAPRTVPCESPALR